MKKKHSILISILFLCLISKTYGVDFSLKLSGGLSVINPTNINQILKNWEKWYKGYCEQNSKFSFIEGEITSLKKAIDLEGELLFTFHPRIAVSIGAGLIFSELNPEKIHITIKNITTNNNRDNTYPQKVTAFPIILSGYYLHPLSSKIKLYAKGSTGLIWAKYVGRKANKESSQDNYNYIFYQNAKTKGPLLAGSLGLMVETNPGINFFFEGSFRKANLDSFKEKDELGTHGTLYFFEEYSTSAELWYSKFQIMEQEPSGENYRSVKTAEINLSGFSVKLGIIINF